MKAVVDKMREVGIPELRDAQSQISSSVALLRADLVKLSRLVGMTAVGMTIGLLIIALLTIVK